MAVGAHPCYEDAPSLVFGVKGTGLGAGSFCEVRVDIRLGRRRPVRLPWVTYPGALGSALQRPGDSGSGTVDDRPFLAPPRLQPLHESVF